MQVRSGTVAARGRHADALPGHDVIAHLDRDAAFAHVPVQRQLTAAVADDDVVGGLVRQRRRAVGITVLSSDHASVQRGVDRHPDVLEREAPHVRVVSLVPIIGVVGAVPIQDGGISLGRVQVDEAGKEQVALVQPGLRVEAIAVRDVSFGCQQQPVCALVRVERSVDPGVLGRGDVGAKRGTLFGRQLRRVTLPSSPTDRHDQLAGSDQAVSGIVLPSGVARWRHER